MRRDWLAACLEESIDTLPTDRHPEGLVKRLRRYREHVFTFLDQPNVRLDNNAAECAGRPAAITGKNT